MSDTTDENEYYEFPEKTINREQGESITLRKLFEKNNDDEYILFDYKIRNDVNLPYNIPDHQRHPQWSKDKMISLIDSLFRGYTITGLIISQHIRNEQIKYDIEDGQTRLSVLQKYHNNEFEFCGLTFDELPEEQKNIFLNYSISREILTPIRGRSEDDFQQDIHNIFERLQMGKALTDADKYWNRSDQPGVEFANQIIEEYKDNDHNYFGTKTYSSKARSVLPEFCAIIGAVLYDQYGPAYRFQWENIKKNISDHQKRIIRTFMNHYLDIITEAENANIPNSNKQAYNKCSKFWGSICMDWKNDNNTLEDQKDKWVNIIKISRNYPNFIKGSQTLYNGLPKSAKQNTTNEAIQTRLQRINDFYSNKEHFTDVYRIEWNLP